MGWVRWCDRAAEAYEGDVFFSFGYGLSCADGLRRLPSWCDKAAEAYEGDVFFSFGYGLSCADGLRR